MKPKFTGGVEAAAKMLSGLDQAGRERILAQIAAKDPQMAEKLKDHLLTPDDLRFMTQKMLVEFLKEIKIKDLGLTLKIAGPELKNYIFKNVSSSIQRDLQEILLGPPVPVNTVQEASERLMQVFRSKVDQGSIVLSKSDEPTV